MLAGRAFGRFLFVYKTLLLIKICTGVSLKVSKRFKIEVYNILCLFIFRYYLFTKIPNTRSSFDENVQCCTVLIEIYCISIQTRCKSPCHITSNMGAFITRLLNFFRKLFSKFTGPGIKFLGNNTKC